MAVATRTRRSSTGAHTTCSMDSSLGTKWGFESKTEFDASQHLLKCRSESYVFRRKPVQDDIWKRPPPDFRMQCYEPNPPKRNSRDANRPWRYGTLPGEEKTPRPTTTNKLPTILTNLQRSSRATSPQFISKIRLLDSYDAKLIFPRDGQYPQGPFQDPKPHDHRGYPLIQHLGLDEFIVKCDRDPYNINFKTAKLNIIHGLDTIDMRDITGRQIGEEPHKLGDKWQARLILPKERYPNKCQETTRHRRLGRSVQSALYERVENKLNSCWAKEKLDKKLREQEEKNKMRKSAAF